MILSAATTLRGLSVCAKVCVCPLADCDKSLVHVTVLKAYKLSTGCLPGSTSPYRFFGTIDLFRYISVCIYIYTSSVRTYIPGQLFQPQFTLAAKYIFIQALLIVSTLKERPESAVDPETAGSIDYGAVSLYRWQ